MKETLKSFFLSYKFKCSALVLLMFMIFAIFIKSLSNYKTIDPIPHISPLTLEVYDSLGPFRHVVKTGLIIENFRKFDVNNNNFIIECSVWFEFDPNKISFDVIGQFDFEKGKIIKKTSPDVIKHGDNVFVQYEVMVELTTDFRFDYYPYGYHILPISITNLQVSTGDVLFISGDSGFNISPDLFLSSWRINDAMAYYGYNTVRFDNIDRSKSMTYSEVLYIIDFVDVGIKNIIVVFIPMLFSLFVSLFSLFTPLSYGVMKPFGISLASLSITSLLGYRYVIQNIMPKVGYMTIADTIYSFILMIVFIPFLLQIVSIFSLSVMNKNLSKKMGSLIVDDLSLTFMISFVILSLISVSTLYYVLIL